MADYRYIRCKLWSDPQIMEYPPDKKLVFVYTFTNEHTSQAGIYAVHENTISLETGVDIERIRTILSELEKEGKIQYTKNKILWVKNFLRYQANTSPKVIIRIAEELNALNDKELALCYLKQNENTLSIPYRYPIDVVSLKENKIKGKEKGKGKGKEKDTLPSLESLPFKTQQEIIDFRKELHDKEEWLKQLDKDPNCPKEMKEKATREISAIEGKIEKLFEMSQ